MQPHSRPQVKRVPDYERRKVFNEAKIWERAMDGEFDVVIIGRGIPTSPDEPPGTESQMLSIRRKVDNFEVARAHAYIRPDNSFGGKGKRPDPKIVLDEDKNILLMEQRKIKA